MGNSYTVLWTLDRCRQLARDGEEGAPLEILFGGMHLSQPGFSTYGVEPGDWIYPVYVRQCVLYVLGRMRVQEILSLRRYTERLLEVFEGCEPHTYPGYMLEAWLRLHPEKRYLAPSCTSEVVLGEEGTPIRLGIAVPSDLLERLRFRSRKGERALKHVEDGRLKRPASLFGHTYRLTEASAAELEEVLLAGLTARSGTRPNYSRSVFARTRLLAHPDTPAAGTWEPGVNGGTALP